MVICWLSRSIAIGRVRSWAISSCSWSGKFTRVAAISIDSKVESREGAYDSLNGVEGNVFREEGKDAAESQVGQEVQDLGPEVKDSPSQDVVKFIIGRWFLSIEVAECNIGSE